MMRSIPFIVALALLAGCDAAEQADLGPNALVANAGLVITHFPSNEDGGPPFYARIEPIPPYVYHDAGYAAVVFYRGPEGIRDDFNLLQFFDGGPAFAVDLNVAGTNLWRGHVLNGSPKIARTEGLGAVPVWFVPVEPLLAFIGGQGPDPVLTLPDLADIEGRIEGLATHLKEVNHPHPLPPDGAGGHPSPSLNLTARGTLDDGRTFNLNLRGRETADGWQRTTQIRFR